MTNDVWAINQWTSNDLRPSVQRNYNVTHNNLTVVLCLFPYLLLLYFYPLCQTTCISPLCNQKLMCFSSCLPILWIICLCVPTSPVKHKQMKKENKRKNESSSGKSSESDSKSQVSLFYWSSNSSSSNIRTNVVPVTFCEDGWDFKRKNWFSFSVQEREPGKARQRHKKILSSEEELDEDTSWVCTKFNVVLKPRVQQPQVCFNLFLCVVYSEAKPTEGQGVQFEQN